MSGAWRLAGLGGLVLFLFGVVSYGFTGTFDIWTAVHVAGGAVLMAVGVVADLARFRRTVTSRGTRERLQATVGAGLFAGILIALNVLAARSPQRWDATAEKIHTLSEKSKTIVSGLAAPVEILAFLPPGDRAREPLGRLLDRFAAETPGRLTWRFADAERERDLAVRLDVRRQGTVVARTERDSAQSVGDAEGRFAEGEIARLVLRVARPEPRRVYVLAGHGEAATDDADSPEGLGLLAQALRAENVELSPLVLSTAPEVPSDAAGLVVAGPRKPLLPHEVDRIHEYLGRGGRTLLLLDPGVTTGLEPVLVDYRIGLGDDLVIDRAEVPFLGARLGLDPLLSDFPAHPITRGFRERVLVSQARSVAPRAEGGLPGTDVRVVARTSESAWGERRWREALESGEVGRDPDDLPGPVAIVVAATSADGRTRIVVAGDSDFARNALVQRYFNVEFLTNAVQWLLGSEDLIAEPAKGFRPSRLELSEGDSRVLFRLSVLLVPEVLLIFGLAMWWRRRAL